MTRYSPSSRKHLGAQRPRVVRRGHDAAVRARLADRDQVARLGERKLDVQGEEVARLADRADDVDLPRRPAVAAEDGDWVTGPVQGRADQVVHAAVADRDSAAGHVLHVEDTRHERPHRADEPAARLEHELGAQVGRDLPERSRIRLDVGVLLPFVADAEAAADVQVPERHPDGPPEVGGLLGRRVHRVGVEELRADVERQADGLQRRMGGGALVGRQRVAVAEPELAPRRAGGDVGVRVCLHVRVQAHGHRRDHAERRRLLGDGVELAERLDV